MSSDIQHVLPMSCMDGVLSIKDRSCLLFAMLGVCVANYLFISFCYACLRLVACVLKDASISVLPILD